MVPSNPILWRNSLFYFHDLNLTSSLTPKNPGRFAFLREGVAALKHKKFPGETAEGHMAPHYSRSTNSTNQPCSTHRVLRHL